MRLTRVWPDGRLRASGAGYLPDAAGWSVRGGGRRAGRTRRFPNGVGLEPSPLKAPGRAKRREQKSIARGPRTSPARRGRSLCWPDQCCRVPARTRRSGGRSAHPSAERRPSGPSASPARRGRSAHPVRGTQTLRTDNRPTRRTRPQATIWATANRSSGRVRTDLGRSILFVYPEMVARPARHSQHGCEDRPGPDWNTPSQDSPITGSRGLQIGHRGTTVRRGKTAIATDRTATLLALDTRRARRTETRRAIAAVKAITGRGSDDRCGRSTCFEKPNT